MRRIVITCSFIVWVIIGGMTVTAQDETTLLEMVQTDDRFSTLANLIEVAGLGDMLSDNEMALTIFAPTNEAFEALPPFVVAHLQSNPDLLAQILRYHIVDERLESETFTTEDVTTLEGSDVSIVTDNMDVTIDGISVSVADMGSMNGIVHAIDAILLPAIDLPAVDPLVVSGDISIAGSSTVFPLTTRIRDDFISAGYSDEIEIERIGTVGGFERFCVSAETDISNASRPISEEEAENCMDNNRTPAAFRVGIDALAVVVNQQNDFVSNLTLDQLVQVFSTAETWSDVDETWPDEPIQRFIPGTDSGTFDYFVEEVFMGDETSILNAEGTRLSEDDEVLAEGIIENQYGVGFFGFAYYNQQRDDLRAVNIEGVEPTSETAESGDYPLARPLFIYSAPQVMQEKLQVAAFINFYLTTVNDVIDDVGYFPASSRALNLARLSWLGATNGGE